MKKPIRTGIVGLGKIAQAQHLPAITESPDFELAFVVDRAVKLNRGVPSYESLEQALRHEQNFDAISICTSPQVRYDLCQQLFETRCAILLEKPAAADYGLARKISEKAKAAGVCLFATWHSRFANQVEAAAAWVTDHELAEGTIEWCENATKWHPGQDWIWRRGGFGVFDPGMNALSILTKIAPVSWSVSSVILSIPENVETPNRAEFTLTHGNTEIGALFEFHEHEADTWTIRMRATNGSILELSDGGASLRIDGLPIHSQQTRSEYENVYRRFGELIRSHASDCDLSPLRLIEDVFSQARIRTAPAVKI